MIAKGYIDIPETFSLISPGINQGTRHLYHKTRQNLSPGDFVVGSRYGGEFYDLRHQKKGPLLAKRFIGMEVNKIENLVVESLLISLGNTHLKIPNLSVHSNGKITTLIDLWESVLSTSPVIKASVLMEVSLYLGYKYRDIKIQRIYEGQALTRLHVSVVDADEYSLYGITLNPISIASVFNLTQLVN